MKKVNMSVRAQARRKRALQRFTLIPSKLKDDKNGYNERKHVELAALKSRLGGLA